MDLDRAVQPESSGVDADKSVINVDGAGTAASQSNLIFSDSTPRQRGYPRQVTALPDEIPPHLGAMMSKDATFEHKRENRLFEDKSTAIWDKQKRKLYDYYLLGTGEKLDARYYRVFSTIGSTMGVTVVAGKAWPRPVVIGRSPSLIGSHLRVWQGKDLGFADSTMEIVRTLDGLQGVSRAVRKMRSRQQRQASTPQIPAKRLARQARRSESWSLPLESDIYENGDEGAFILSDEDDNLDHRGIPADELTSPPSGSSNRQPPALKKHVRIYLRDDEEDTSSTTRTPPSNNNRASYRDVPNPASFVRPTPSQDTIANIPPTRPRLIVKLKLPRRASTTRQQPTPDEENDRVRNVPTMPDVIRMPDQPSRRPETAGPTVEPQQEVNNEDSDSDSVMEIDNPVVTVKAEVLHSPIKPSVSTISPDENIIVVFRNDADETTRQRPWRDCSNVRDLYMQAVVGKLFKTSKDTGALSVAVQNVDEEVTIMKGDVDDFGVLCEAISLALKMKKEGSGEALVVEVRSL